MFKIFLFYPIVWLVAKLLELLFSWNAELIIMVTYTLGILLQFSFPDFIYGKVTLISFIINIAPIFIILLAAFVISSVIEIKFVTAFNIVIFVLSLVPLLLLIIDIHSYYYYDEYDEIENEEDE